MSPTTALHATGGGALLRHTPLEQRCTTALEADCMRPRLKLGSTGFGRTYCTTDQQTTVRGLFGDHRPSVRGPKQRAMRYLCCRTESTTGRPVFSSIYLKTSQSPCRTFHRSSPAFPQLPYVCLFLYREVATYLGLWALEAMPELRGCVRPAPNDPAAASLSLPLPLPPPRFCPLSLSLALSLPHPQRNCLLSFQPKSYDPPARSCALRRRCGGCGNAEEGRQIVL